ncbi:hypothetical protein Y032_0001g99 [Ancylostoma ceylanicum]|uniref:Uncharacterized protein n=1 Tax=Ancylostoma ceylanicum TaxID=53326 RepID=A0A016W4X0_9BILA|nr:hypothetical protein Y032_0001g99 [Ancylostoma ceylanicum]
MPGEGSNSVIRVPQRPKGEKPGNGSNGGVRGAGVQKRGNAWRRVQRSYTRKDIAHLLHSCGKGALDPESLKVQKTRVLIN